MPVGLPHLCRQRRGSEAPCGNPLLGPQCIAWTSKQWIAWTTMSRGRGPYSFTYMAVVRSRQCTEGVHSLALSAARAFGRWPGGGTRHVSFHIGRACLLLYRFTATQVCKNCGTKSTPFWRKDKNDGKPLCNACGLYFSKNDAPRPKILWKQDEGGGSRAAAQVWAVGCGRARTRPGCHHRPGRLWGMHTQAVVCGGGGVGTGTWRAVGMVWMVGHRLA